MPVKPMQRQWLAIINHTRACGSKFTTRSKFSTCTVNFYYGGVLKSVYTYIYIYAVKLLSGPSLGFLEVIIWSKFVFF